MRSEPKTALLHYWLTGMRGGEKVLEELCRIFSDADIYTHACIPERISDVINSHSIHESLISRLPKGRSHCQTYLPLMPLAQRQWDLSGYDLIISSESGPVKGIRKPWNCRHICYCHTPMRYLWDFFDEYYMNSGICGKIAMKVFKNYLRRYDLQSAECVDQFIANSRFVAERIKRIYGREAVVIYPPVDVGYFRSVPDLERRYYLFVGQLVCYKRPDLVISAFAKLQNETLVVVGEGPLRKYLEKKSSSNVRFLGRVSREELRTLYASSKALIFPGIEDFGIVPVEAMAACCPVIAMNYGGTAESVVDGKTGVLMREQSTECILNAIEEVASRIWLSADFHKQTASFASEYFYRQITGIL